MKYKKGDTLIEVTLAIGVFSMIAIAVVSVMNSGTSGAQSSLETTLAREEIDAQAEALRFIQASYISDKGLVKDTDAGASTNRFQNLWKDITSLSVAPTEEITKYQPKSCKDVYSTSNPFYDKMFVLNTRFLNDFDYHANNIKNSSYGDSVLFTRHSDKMAAPSTYPRLIYRKPNQPADDTNLLESASSSKNLFRAEGIYIVAVQDQEKGTTIVSDTGNPDEKSAFYDFYIRSCWYSSGANTPSTISTVIRLYDPDAVAERDGVVLSFNSNGGKGTMSSIFIPAGKTKTLPANTFKWGNVDESLYEFVGWSTKNLTTVAEVNAGAAGTYKDGGEYKAPTSTYSREYKTLYAVWDIDRFWVDVNLILDGVRKNSGLAEFKVKSYIDGVYIDESNDGTYIDNGNGTTTRVTLNDHDFYQPVYFGSKLRIELFDVEGYTLDNSEESLCQNVIGPCTVTPFDGGTAIEFTANGIPEGTVINDSYQYAINIEPRWTTIPPEEPEEPEEPTEPVEP